MLNYLNMECYRIRKKYSAYLIPIFSTLAIGMMIWMFLQFGDPIHSSKSATTFLLDVIALIAQCTPLFLLMPLELFYENEWKHKTISRAIEAGYKRETLFFGKLAGIYLYSFLVILWAILCASVSTFLFLHEKLNMVQIGISLSYFGWLILALTFYVALYILLSIHIENGILRGFLYYLIFILDRPVSVLFALLGYKNLLRAISYWPGDLVKDLIHMIQVSCGAVSHEDLTPFLEHFYSRVGIVVALGLLMMLLALWQFKKKEI